jgi:ribA/ribD-fused uncharacterized protein
MIDNFEGDYRFLSNFYSCPVEFEGIIYPSSEHAYQAAKTLDQDERIAVKICTTAAIAKKLGRQVTVRSDWNAIKVDIMRKIVKTKFSSPGLRAYC